MSRINTVCVIDDDKIFTFAVKRLLAISDCCENVIEYSNGEEAISGLRALLASNRNMPELILLDLNMPIMDGWQFLDEFITIRELTRIKIYIVSSSIDPADIEKSKKYNSVSKYITKPLDKEILKKIINSSL